MSHWLLPESLADILPAEARRIEELRRNLLDLYRTYGFELVAPPLVEYIDSLLSGTGSALNLRTCKLIDQLSGRTMGVRADMTPQVSRIDAHLLNREGATRLCYCGSVLHARPAGLLFETSNPRHQHDWEAFVAAESLIPEDKILIPGCLDSTTNFIEHPKVVAERVTRFTELFGPERVIAGTDCGFSTFAGFGAVFEPSRYASCRS